MLSRKSPREFPKISAAESKAFELLTLCYVRAGRISEWIRAQEPIPSPEQVTAVYEQAHKDLRAVLGSIAYHPSATDVKQRAEHLRKCREVFGRAHPYPSNLLACCAVYCAIEVIVDLELGSSKHCDFLMYEANKRCVQELTAGAQTASGVSTTTPMDQPILQGVYPPYPNMATLYLGATFFYILDGQPRECHVDSVDSHYSEGNRFVVSDGPVDERPEQRELSESEMESLADLSEEIVYACV